MRVDARGEKVVEVLTSAAGERRVGITRDSSGVYRLRVETWAPDWEHMRVATWLQSSHEGSFADSLETARSLAAEILGGADPADESDGADDR